LLEIVTPVPEKVLVPVQTLLLDRSKEPTALLAALVRLLATKAVVAFVAAVTTLPRRSNALLTVFIRLLATLAVVA
jgi:hypothetical protein